MGTWSKSLRTPAGMAAEDAGDDRAEGLGGVAAFGGLRGGDVPQRAVEENGLGGRGPDIDAEDERIHPITLPSRTHDIGNPEMIPAQRLACLPYLRQNDLGHICATSGGKCTTFGSGERRSAGLCG